MTSLLQGSHLNTTKIILTSLCCKRATATIFSPSFRLYSGLGLNIQFDNRERRPQTLQLISVSRCSPVSSFKVPCRTITVGETITFIEGVVDAIPGPILSPVDSVKDLYVWTEATTGLPWWITIVLVTLSWRAVTFLPSAIKLEQLTSRRENCNLELLPVQQELFKPARSKEARKEAINAFMEFKKNLIKERKCQPHKTFLTVLYQATNVLLVSVAIRRILLTAGGSGLREATLPWGVELGLPDYMFILPLINFLLNVIMVEVDAQKLKKETAEMHMVLDRSITKGPKYDDKMKRLNINVRRAGCLIIIPVYLIIPSGINLSWTVMILSGIMARMALQHPTIRRRFGIERRPFETEQPCREFLAHLGGFLRRKSKTVEKK